MGSVLAVISDKKLGSDMNADNHAEYYQAQIKSATDYYPFGWAIPGRQLISSDYRYGYQGSEKNKERNTGSYTTLYRQLDARVSRWLSIDPLASNYPSMSPYISMGNNPIMINDPLGDSIPTKFLGKNGRELKRVPRKVQRMYNREYGIKVGYNAETQMLYKEGDVETDQWVADGAKRILEGLLGETNSEVKQVFGYNLAYEGTPVAGGRHIQYEGANTTLIDLADFGRDLHHRGIIQFYKSNSKIVFNSHIDRAFNLGRIYEHEFIAHGLEGRIDGMHNESAHNRINQLSRIPLLLPTMESFNNSTQGIPIYWSSMSPRYRPWLFHPAWRRSSFNGYSKYFGVVGGYAEFSNGLRLLKAGSAYNGIIRKRTNLSLNGLLKF